MNRRQKKKALKREYPGHWAWRRPGHCRRERLARCPVCGRSRATGYFRSCKNCAQVLEYRDAAMALCDQLKGRMKHHGASLHCSYSRDTLHLEVNTSRDVIVDDITGNTHERESVAFCSSCRVSLREFCGSAQGLKECIIDSVKTLYSQVIEKVQSTVDSNGRVKRIAGCEVPVQGNWRG